MTTYLHIPSNRATTQAIIQSGHRSLLRPQVLPNSDKGERTFMLDLNSERQQHCLGGHAHKNLDLLFEPQE